jgi:hypothetical protein
MGFLGVTAHWIEGKEGKWKMRASVVGFRALSGAHDGKNLGRYLVGVLDRVGILSKTASKVRNILLHRLTNPDELTAIHGDVRQYW